MSDESFYGVNLTGESNTVQWEVLSNDEDFLRGRKLIIRQILLGAETKEDKFNVEVHTVKDNLRITIAVTIEFCETSATLKFTMGNGPVYIHDQNIKDEVKVVDMEDDETDEEDEHEVQPKKNQKLENNADVKSVKNKKK